jgi:hypothetical protein
MVRGPISMVIVGIILLGVIALVMGGPALFDRVLPRSAVAFLDDFGLSGGMASLGGGMAADPKGSGDLPSDYLYDSTDGIEAKGPIAAWTGNEPVFINDVITGYTTRVDSDIPTTITKVRSILGCGFTPPLQGTIVGHATAGTSDIDLAISTYNDAQLAAAVQTFVDVYRETGAMTKTGAAGGAYQAYDVAVTETRAPVFLVLQNRFGNRIWNIHLAAGARIERVILLGGTQAGVANLDPVVPVEVMLADGMEACGITPAYPLNEGALLFQSLASGALSQADADLTLGRIAAAVADYDAWFRASFGVGALESRVGWDRGTISVIGPVPAEGDPMAIWAPIAGAEIRTTQDTFFEIRGQVAEGTDFASRVRAIATSFAWGDLKNLRQGVEF